MAEDGGGRSAGAPMPEWREIVQPYVREEAMRLLEEWRNANPALSAGLRQTDIRIDLVLGRERRCLARVMVRSCAVDVRAE
jgi:hypothetical protein